MKVLVADDSRTMRRIYREILGRVGYSDAEIAEAERGEDVIARVSQPEGGIDLVIADWDLPGMDGLSLLGRVAKTRSLNDVGILFVVNACQLAKAREAVSLGARGFVVRPFQEEDLRDRIRAAGTGLELRRTTFSTGALRAMVTAAREESELPFLMRMPSALISEVLRLSKKERHAPGSTLLRAGEEVRELFILTSGEVEVSDPARPSAPRLLGAGECFAEWAFLKEAPSPVTVRARTQLEVARLGRAALEDLGRRHPEIGTYLAARARRRETDMLRAPPGESAELSGSLSSLAFADVIQFLQSAGRSGKLLLKQESLSAEIHFEAGEVRHARSGELEGEAAFYRVALWTSGSFSFQNDVASPPPTIRLPTLTLLMEAMRLADEAKK